MPRMVKYNPMKGRFMGHAMARFDELDLGKLWLSFLDDDDNYFDATSTRRIKFARYVAKHTREPLRVDTEMTWCADCHYPMLVSDVCTGTDGYEVCARCFERYIRCDYCDGLVRPGYAIRASDEMVCAPCIETHYRWCEPCDTHFRTEFVEDHDHDEGSGCCASPALTFTIPNGDTTLANDTRAKIELPAGEISPEGLDRIRQAIQARVYDYDSVHDRVKVRTLARSLAELGTVWQNKKGNYSKRLSSYAYKEFGIKIMPALLTEVGNIARDHSTGVDFSIEVTRDLNLSAREFGHEESCWWQSYYESRCTLKSNGGFGMRTFDDDDHVTGRVWLMPLRQLSNAYGTYFQPTFNAMTPDAFVLFNGYGKLSSYAPARILSHMTGMTYRKVEFSCSPMYTNGGTGYLVGPEDVISPYTDGSLDLSLSTHSDLFTQESKELVHA